MKSALNKDFVRDIKNSKGRFISILLIVALGVAFFAGIKDAPLVMKKTSDLYYDDYNLMDIRVTSTLGLTDDDVDAIKKIDNVVNDLELDLPPINKQILIGKIYYQSIRKNRYERRLIELKQLLLNKSFLIILFHR